MKLSIRLRLFLSFCFLLLSGYIFLGHAYAGSSGQSYHATLYKAVPAPARIIISHTPVTVRIAPFVADKETQQLDDTDSEDEDDESFQVKKYPAAPAPLSYSISHLIQHSALHSFSSQTYGAACGHTLYSSPLFITFRSIRV